MAKGGKIVLQQDAVRELLQSEEIKKACVEQASRLQNICGGDSSIDTYTGRTRVNAMLTGSREGIERVKGAMRK